MKEIVLRLSEQQNTHDRKYRRYEHLSGSLVKIILGGREEREREREMERKVTGSYCWQLESIFTENRKRFPPGRILSE